MMKKPIFIHSLFRTGSTYIWNKFRQNTQYHCYYEPFHQILSSINEKNIETAFTKNHELVNHPPIEKHYLHEYKNLTRPEKPGIKYFKKSFSFDEFVHNQENPDLKKYIDSLIKAAGNKTPLFQFNRSALRIEWFKNHYPEALHIYLVREPRGQWESYFRLYKRTNDLIFFVMDLLTVSLNQKSGYFQLLARHIPLFEYHSENFDAQKDFYQLILDTYPDKEKYFIFYYTWFVCLMENVLKADFILNINRLSRSKRYREEVLEFLSSRGIENINFEDSRIREYSSFLLDTPTLTGIENAAARLVLQNKTGDQIHSFFHNISPKDLDYFKFAQQGFLELKKDKLMPPGIRNQVIDRSKKIISLFSNQYVKQLGEAKELNRTLARDKKQLENYAQQLAQKNQQLTRKDEQIKTKDAQSAQLQNQVKQQRASITRYENLLNQKGQQIVDQKTRIENLEKKLEQKDAQVIRQEDLLEQKDTQIIRQKNLLERKDAPIIRQEKLLEQKDSQIIQQERLLEQKDSQIIQQRNLLEQKNAQILRQKELLEKKDAQTIRQKNLLEQKDAQIKQQKSLLEQKDAKIKQHQVQLTQKNQQIRQKNTKIIESDARMQKIHRSYSYRLGRGIAFPIRKAKKIFKGIERIAKGARKKLLGGKISTRKMAFIDHSFHQKSRATFFLIDLLKKHYDVTVFWDESWNKKPPVNLEKIVDAGFGTVVFFQIIHYPPGVLKILEGLNVIVIPMVDACWDLPDSYWDKFANCKFINFSKALHERFRRLGFISMHVQYFPSPDQFPVSTPGFEGLKAFFWQRTEDITWSQIKQLVRDTGFQRFHIHGAVDPPGSNAKQGQTSYHVKVPTEKEIKKYNIIMSNWFVNRQDYFKLLQDFNIYFAPRKYEGIGMSFLEAMAMGKCVVAADNPTMNEYIRHGENGLLYDPDNPVGLDFSNADQIAANARESIKQGYRNWQKSQKPMINFIKAPIEELEIGSHMVYHLNSRVGGGAAIAARRIFEPLVKAGMNGRFYSLDNLKKPGYFQFSPLKDKNLPVTSWLRFKRYIRKKKLEKYFKNRPEKYEAFSYTKLPYKTPISAFGKLPAVVHLHWIPGLLDFPSFFNSIPDDLPVVWTAHDMNPLTGGCHYSWECEKYKDGCDSCPQLNGYRNNRLSGINFKIKWEAIKNKNLHIVANSKWTEARARESLLFKNVKSFQTIYYGLDVKAFRPLGKNECRKKLDLKVKPGTLVISFGADYLPNRRKGFLELLQALKILEKQDVDIVCLVFGRKYETGIDIKFQKKYLGFLRTPEQLATMYSASDVFIMPSLYEAFGQTVIEAMACETPVVGFNAGGIPELITDGVTGLLAKVGDPKDLAEKIKFMILNPKKRRSMGKKARKIVENQFTLQLQVEKYQALYKGLIK